MLDESAVPSGVVGLLGGGSQARETASYLAPRVPMFWAVAPEFHEPSDGRTWIDIAHPDPTQVATPVVAAVGTPALRRDLVDQWPGSTWATVIAPSAQVVDVDLIGPGTVVASGAILSVNVQTAEHCLINVGATLSHDVRLGAYATISPGVHVAGIVTIGEGAFLGIGSVVSNGVTLAPGVVVAAGAVVMSDVTEPNAVVAGVPAQVVKVREGWLRDL